LAIRRDENPRPSPPPSSADRTAEGDLPVLAGVRRVRSLRGFNEALRASGYGAFRQEVPSIGTHLGLTLGRWRLRIGGNDAWMSAPSTTGPGAVRAYLFEVRLDGGYEFLRWRGLTGFALLGVSGASFTMDALAPHWNYLGAGAGGQAAHLGNPPTIQRDVMFLTLQTGFEHVFPLGGDRRETFALLISIQAGYTQQLALGPWFSDKPHADVPGTPDVDFSGTWIALGAGFAALDGK
jgi:hypothetical protein